MRILSALLIGVSAEHEEWSDWASCSNLCGGEEYRRRSPKPDPNNRAVQRAEEETQECGNSNNCNYDPNSSCYDNGSEAICTCNWGDDNDPDDPDAPLCPARGTINIEKFCFTQKEVATSIKKEV